MAAGFKQLERVAGIINYYGERHLSNKIGEWKQHYDFTEKHQRCATELATAQRRSSTANYS